MESRTESGAGLSPEEDAPHHSVILQRWDPDHSPMLELLQHERLARILDVPDVEGEERVLLVEPLVGETLRERLERVGELGFNDALELASQLLDVLVYLHAEGWAHSELRPENVLFTAGSVKLIGLGALTWIEPHEDDADLRKSLSFEVWPSVYAAPESMQGRGADEQTDLWALGVMLLEMTVGFVPGVRSPMELAMKLGGVGLHPLLRPLVERCISVDTQGRWHSAESMRAAVRYLLEENNKPVELEVYTGRKGDDAYQPYTRVLTQPLVIGRGSRCDILIREPSISRQGHARLERFEGRVRLIPLREDVRVKRVNEVMPVEDHHDLRAGDLIGLGSVDAALKVIEAPSGLDHLAPDEVAPILHDLELRIDLVNDSTETRRPEPTTLSKVLSSAWIGRVIKDRYEVKGFLGEGATGKVFRGRDRVEGRDVAIKIVRTSDGEDIVDRKAALRSLREREALRSLEHPNTVRLLDDAIDDDEMLDANEVCILVLEFLPGPSLSSLISDHYESLSFRWMLELGQQLASVLEVMSGVGLIHRDLKPVNILFDDPDWTRATPRIIDFGLSIQGSSESFTTEGYRFGSAYYLSPEQATGEGDITLASDVYALGAILYQLFSRRRPFEGKSDMDTIKLSVTQSAPPLEPAPHLGVAHPEPLDALIQWMLEKEPTARPSAEQLHLALRWLTSHYGFTEGAWTEPERALLADIKPRLLGETPPGDAGPRRISPRAIAIAAVLLIASIGALLFFLGGDDAAPPATVAEGAAPEPDPDEPSPDEPPVRGAPAASGDDSAGPSITVLSPAATTVRGLPTRRVRRKGVTVRLEVKDDSEVASVRVQDTEATALEDGAWEARVALVPGANELVVTAEDVHGNRTREPLKIERSGGEVALVATRQGGDHALLIALQAYTKWPALGSPISDVMAIGDALNSNYGFQVETLINPSEQEIWTTLEDYRERDWERDDQLLVFIAGHGYYDGPPDKPELGRGYLVPLDAPQDGLPRNDYIAFQGLVDEINRVEVQHALLTLDVCHGGAIFRGFRGGASNDREPPIDLGHYITQKLKHRTRKAITSGSAEQQVLDGGARDNSPFANRFLAALRSVEGKPVGGRESVLTFYDIMGYVDDGALEGQSVRAGSLATDAAQSDFLFVAQ